MSFLGNLNWRRAVKSFDQKHPAGSQEIETILDSIRQAPTSFGLQPFRVEVIRDLALRETLKPFAWNQDQITSSTALLVFLADSNVGQRITDMLELIANGNPQARAGLKGYEDMMRGSLEGRPPDSLQAWAAKQAYIALGFAMAAAAELKVDSCPIEGFSGPDFDRILALERGLNASVLLAVGQRNPDVALNPSFRFPPAKLFRQR